MASSNPAFTNSPAFSSKAVIPAAVSVQQLDELYGRPAATPVETDRMTYEDTIVKTAVSFGILVVGAVLGWMVPILALPAALIGFVLALVNIFKKKPSKALVLSYAVFEGVFVGGISAIFETMYPGIAVQAVLATLSVVGVTLALFASGKVRASKRATKIFLIAMVGYALFSLINFGMMAFGATSEPFGMRSMPIDFLGGLPLGVVLGVLVIFMAAYSLVLDFDSVQQGVRKGAPRVYAWQAAFGIMMTVVWLYVEILRLLAILRGND
jgi:uncharacterized YccA/Bax inhibitor family protein